MRDEIKKRNWMVLTWSTTPKAGCVPSVGSNLISLTASLHRSSDLLTKSSPKEWGTFSKNSCPAHHLWNQILDNSTPDDLTHKIEACSTVGRIDKRMNEGAATASLLRQLFDDVQFAALWNVNYAQGTHFQFQLNFLQLRQRDGIFEENSVVVCSEEVISDSLILSIADTEAICIRIF